MSKPDQNVPKVLGVVCNHPPDRIRIPLHPGIILRHVLSDWMQFRNLTPQNSGEEAVAGSGLGCSLGLIPWKRPLEKADEDGRGDLGG